MGLRLMLRVALSYDCMNHRQEMGLGWGLCEKNKVCESDWSGMFGFVFVNGKMGRRRGKGRLSSSVVICWEGGKSG